MIGRRGSPRRAWLMPCLALPASLISGLGCLTEHEVAITQGGLNERFTLDRQPLTQTQQQEDPTVGLFSRADGVVASRMYPLVSHADRLHQAACFWLAHDAGAGDDVLLNWEAFVVMDIELSDGVAFADGDEDLSLCRFNDPVTRQAPLLVDEGYEIADDAVMVHTAPNLDGFPLHLELSVGDRVPSAEVDFSFENGRETYAAYLYELHAPVVSGNDRACPDFSQTQGQRRIERDVLGYDGGSSEDGRIGACSGQGRRVRPERDARFHLRFEVDGMPTVQQNLGDVMVAGPGEMLRRPLGLAADGSRRWNAGIIDGRWTENFSPSLRIEEVRVLRGDAQGEYLTPGDLFPATLCVRSELRADECLWTCQARPAADGAAAFRPLDGDCHGPNGEPGVARLTPTYDIDQLEAGSQLVNQPLSWRFFASASADLKVEFRLTTEFAPLALMVDALTDFGDLPPGSRRDHLVALRNIGGQPARVEALGFDGASRTPQDFGFQALSHAAPVPVPVEVVGHREGAAGVRLAEDYASFPAYDLQLRNGEQVAWIMPTDLAGTEYEVNGEPLVVDGGLLLSSRPGADFERAPNPGVSRPFGLVSHYPLVTPFVLGPGQSVWINLRAAPLSAGDKHARLRIDYSNASDASQSDHAVATMVARSLTGPQPAAQPAQLVLHDFNGDTQRRRNAVLTNYGDLPLEVSDSYLTGSGKYQFDLVQRQSSGFALQPGETWLFGVIYYDTCPTPGDVDEHEAELRIESNAGPLSVPIRGWSGEC